MLTKPALHVIDTEQAYPPTRAWQRMLSGRRLNLLDPTPVDIEIEDIAHGLARVARWNGQTEGEFAFSVAQHSLFVEAIAVALRPNLSRQGRLTALLHDAAEYVMGDLITPFKTAIGLNYRDLEEQLQRCVHIRFGLRPLIPKQQAQIIKRADRIAAYHEAVRLAGFSEADARRYFGEPPVLVFAETLRLLAPRSATEAQAAYLARFNELHS